MSELPGRISEYLGRLPEGLASYPDVCVVPGIVSLWTKGHDADVLQSALPASLRGLVSGQSGASAWIPEVHATVVYLTLRELFFSSDDAFVRDAHTRNQQLLGGSRFGDPPRLSPANIEGKSRALFNQMHRGIGVEADVTRQPWTWRLTFPPHLVPPLLARCYATALAAGLEFAGKKAVYIELVDHSADFIDVAFLFEH